MSYRNSICDIVPGSTWNAADGASAVVIAAADGYVGFRRSSGSITVEHERDFRRAYCAIYDRAKLRSQFTMSLANLVEFTAWWLPSQRKLVCRSVACSRRFAIPLGALPVGTYGEPCSAQTFFEDLDDVLRRHGSGPIARHVAVGSH